MADDYPAALHSNSPPFAPIAARIHRSDAAGDWVPLHLYIINHLSMVTEPQLLRQIGEAMQFVLQKFANNHEPARMILFSVLHSSEQSCVGPELLLLHTNVVEVLCQILDRPVDEEGEGLRVDTLYMFCTLLHCSQTRNWFAQQAIDLDAVPGLLKFLEADQVDASPRLLRAGLLAVNWFAGSDIGAAHVISGVDRIMACYQRCDPTAPHKVSLFLTLANLPAFLEHDQVALHALLERQIVDVLVPVLEEGVVRKGAVGALMGLATLGSIDACARKALLSSTDQIIGHVVDCMQCALDGEAQENILWSPWQPAQSICNIVSWSSEVANKFKEHGILDLLLSLLSDADMNKQAEPERDEAFGVRCVYEMLIAGVEFGDLSQTFTSILAVIARKGKSAMAREYARLAVEQLYQPGTHLPVLLSLQSLARVYLHRCLPPGCDIDKTVESFGLSVQLNNFMRYQVPTYLRYWRIRQPSEYSYSEAKAARLTASISLSLTGAV